MNKGKLIAFAGKARHGKTTAARSAFSPQGRAICRREPILSFAAPIKEMVAILVEQFHGILKAKTLLDDRDGIIPGIEKSPRELWQTLGTEWGRKLVHPDIWVNACISRAKSFTNTGYNVAIDDVRFQNEVDAILEAGGEVYYIQRPDFDMGYTHASETQELTGLTSVILNDSTLDLFKKKISNIFKP